MVKYSIHALKQIDRDIATVLFYLIGLITPRWLCINYIIKNPVHKVIATRLRANQLTVQRFYFGLEHLSFTDQPPSGNPFNYPSWVQDSTDWFVCHGATAKLFIGLEDNKVYICKHQSTVYGEYICTDTISGRYNRKIANHVVDRIKVIDLTDPESLEKLDQTIWEHAHDTRTIRLLCLSRILISVILYGLSLNLILAIISAIWTPS